MIGKTLSHFKIIAKLGEGGMGEVYLAEDTKLDRKVAIKVLPTEMASDPELLARFDREAKAVAALNHPNIVTVHSVEEAAGIHFFTMELVEGETLGRLIPPEGMPIEKFLDLALPVADALAEAHEQGITHRDLKPGNIMVDQKGRAKILDFGLAKLWRSTSALEASQLPTEDAMTQEGMILGTCAYMSPEQAQGQTVYPPSDVFSLGIVLYEMATGSRPFHGDNKLSILTALIRDTPEPISDSSPALPPELSEIVARCLRKDPAKRYANASGLKEDLERLQAEYQTTLASLEEARTEQGRLAQEVHVLAAEIESLEARTAAARTREAVGNAIVSSSGYAEAQQKLKGIRSSIRERNKLLQYYQYERRPVAGDAVFDVQIETFAADPRTAIDEVLAEFPER